MLLFGIGSLDFRDDAGVPAMLFPHGAPEPGRKIVASARLN
jgi:hypothetical protein